MKVRNILVVFVALLTLFFINFYISFPSLAASISSWTPITNISQTTTASQKARIALDMAGHPHVVWHELVDEYQVLYSGWHKNGWSKPIILSQPGKRAWFPATASDADQNIHVVWTSGAHGDPSEILYRKLAGKHWSPPLKISDGFGDASFATIATENGNVYVAWSSVDTIGGQNWRVFYRQWDGLNWSTPELVSGDIVSSLVPYIAVKSGVVHIIWSGTAPDNPSDVFYRRLDASGWSPIINVTSSPTKSSAFGLVVDNTGRVHMTWEEEMDPSTGFVEVFYRSLLNDGLSPILKLSDSTWASHGPRIATDRTGNLCFVWETHGQILYQSLDGNGWSSPVVISSPSYGGGYPDIACDPKGYPHVVWEDYQPGNIEVVYTRGVK